jgi:enoyl-CoA hydratase/carnithine racemase
MADASSTVIFEVRDHVAWITLNRPEKLNAITIRMREELMRAVRTVQHDRGIWLAVLTGNGRAFSTGHDLSEPVVEKGTPENPIVTIDDLYLAMAELTKPIIGAINGHCYAQGAGIAFLTDVRIAADTALFGWPQAKYGLPSMSGPCIAAHRLPLNIALELFYTGDAITASELHRHGAVNHVVPAADVLSTAEALARKISANSAVAIHSMKKATVMGMGLSLRDRLGVASMIVEATTHSNDHAEGMRAFAEKRAPKFTGT